MNTETVLSNDRIVEIARKLRWQTQYPEIQNNVIELSRLIEQAVLQSPEMQALRKGIERHAGVLSALRNLEQACDDLAAARTRDGYLLEVASGREGYLIELDDARRAARAVIDAAMQEQKT